MFVSSAARPLFIAGLLAGVLATGIWMTTCHQSPPVSNVKALNSALDRAAARQAASSARAATPAPPTPAGGLSYADVAQSVVPSVVTIHATRERRGMRRLRRSPFFLDPFFRRFFGHRGPGKGRRPKGGPKATGLGSGVILSADGDIVTNYHVVARADEIRVTLANKRRYEAKVKGTDPRSDLALLEIDAPDLDPIELGSSKSLRVGDVVLAVGNPFGAKGTVTMGIVSAKGRAGMGITDYEDFIQTDAAINPGNSGGALVDTRGRLVGVPTAILSRSGGYQGIGFAIPTGLLRPVIRSIRQHGEVKRGYLGIRIQQPNEAMAKAFGIKPHQGIVVGFVEPGTPAAKAGLQRGDVIVSLDGKPVRSVHRFRNAIARQSPGSAVRLKVLRKGEAREVEVTLGRLPKAKKRAARGGPGAPGRRPRGQARLDGVKVTNLTPLHRRKLKLSADVQGVLVTRVAPGSAAQQAGLRPGDVIVSLNRQPTPNLGAFSRAAKRADDAILVLIHRRGSTLYLAWKKR
jgi:serine protease Do